MLDFNNCFYLYRSNYELSIVDNFRIIDDKQIELNIKHADNSVSNEIVDKNIELVYNELKKVEKCQLLC